MLVNNQTEIADNDEQKLLTMMNLPYLFYTTTKLARIASTCKIEAGALNR